ncbi:MAG: SGNH/GDSL hydrolase family protein, partial [Lachnospiraceae bacterium]|nr:SGNH/GDSL hydrolase family protein [Lachnospiraceae bacterium]
MNKNDEMRLQRKRKRLKKILIAEAVVAVLAVAAAAVFALLPLKSEPGSETATLTQAVSADTGNAESGTEKETPGTGSSAPADTAKTEDPGSTTAKEDTTESAAGNDDSTGAEEHESTSSEETQAPESTPEETTPGSTEPDYSRIVFVGDSRTKTMSSGGRYEFRLVPDDSVSATWGGQLTDEAAFTDAAAAAAKMREKAVFWFGINDVQLNPERDNPEVFIRNYDRMLTEFRTVNDYSTIYLLSILPTSVNERDYYEGQDDNIRAYNEALKIYAAEHGYVYLDLSPLYTGEECFAEGDQIHFSESWYRERFIPAVTAAVG